MATPVKCRGCGGLYPDGGYYHMNCMPCRKCGRTGLEMREFFCKDCHPNPTDPWIRRIVPWSDDPARNYMIWNDEEDNVKPTAARVVECLRKEAGARVRVKSNMIAFYTRLDANQDVETNRKKIATRFPESESDFQLFLEETNAFVMLYPDEKLSDFDAWGDGAKVRFMKRSWVGNDKKDVLRRRSRGGAISRPNVAPKEPPIDEEGQMEAMFRPGRV